MVARFAGIAERAQAGPELVGGGPSSYLATGPARFDADCKMAAPTVATMAPRPFPTTDRGSGVAPARPSAGEGNIIVQTTAGRGRNRSPALHPPA